MAGRQKGLRNRREDGKLEKGGWLTSHLTGHSIHIYYINEWRKGKGRDEEKGGDKAKRVMREPGSSGSWSKE